MYVYVSGKQGTVYINWKVKAVILLIEVISQNSFGLSLTEDKETFFINQQVEGKFMFCFLTGNT